MVAFFQEWLYVDAATAAFAAAYLAALVALYLANAAYLRIAPARRPAGEGNARKGDLPIQRASRQAIAAVTGWIASRNITPNQITLVGLALVLFCCGYYLHHRNSFLFGTSLIVAYLFDMLDGVVARAQGTTSKFGGYLDAVVDRYQEIATYLVIGWVTQMWLLAFLVITGSMLTSYNKARAAIETSVDNKGWPDLLGKGTRLFILCVALIGDATLPWFLPFTLFALAVMTHYTAVQRIVRSYLLIEEASRRTGARLPGQGDTVG